jgi:hypothetical protein
VTGVPLTERRDLSWYAGALVYLLLFVPLWAVGAVAGMFAQALVRGVRDGRDATDAIFEWRKP